MARSSHRPPAAEPAAAPPVASRGTPGWSEMGPSEPMPFTLDQIRQALAGHRPRLLEPVPHQAEAAVALVLAGAAELALCVIRRAEHPGDPWSGHLALPGGRADPADPHPRAVAERETMAEVGLALDDRHWLGGLSHALGRSGGRDRATGCDPSSYRSAPARLPPPP